LPFSHTKVTSQTLVRNPNPPWPITIGHEVGAPHHLNMIRIKDGSEDDFELVDRTRIHPSGPESSASMDSRVNGETEKACSTWDTPAASRCYRRAGG
jgi:hypothetical protein